MEWANKNKFNSFNSWKGLLYADWYKAVINGKFRPPVEASLDPIHACNLKCQHCNAHRYMGENDPDRMTDTHLINLVQFLGEWGVKAICFGGGGEPTLHSNLANAIIETRKAKMEASMATNGTMLKGDFLDVIPLLRWIGVSVDAATAKTYKKLKMVDRFNDVIGNLIRVSKNPGDCDVSFKFLISSLNQHEVYDACKLAKEIGVKDFHARPMDFHHQGMGEELDGKLANVNIDLVLEQMEKCHELEDENFRVFTVVHKFNKNFLSDKSFSQCYGAPLVIQLCADGNVYFCVDQRHQKDFILGQHFPNPKNILKFWGKDKHQELVFGDTPEKCFTRCTFGVYCEQCEKLFASKEDPMCWRFI